MSQKEAQAMAEEELNSPAVENNTEGERSELAPEMGTGPGPQEAENPLDGNHSAKGIEDSVAVTKEMGGQDGTNLDQSFDQNLEEVKPPLINTHPGVSGHRRIGAQKVMFTTQTSASAISSPPATTAVAGKRSVVLSNEARKEMAKQARALKDERRALLDSRHKYLIAKIANGVSLGEVEVEEALISDDKFSMIEEFFSAHGSKRLLFYYQVVQLEVNFGMLDCTDANILQSLEKLFTDVMYPALRSQEDWGVMKEGQGDSHVQDFLLSVDRFICSLSSARKNMEDKFQLHNMVPSPDLSHLQEPVDYINAANNSELVESLELVLLHWAKQIEQVLAESEQMRKEADDIGPSVELEYWKSRMSTFNSLLDEIKQPQVKTVIGVLQVAKSKTLSKWKELDGNITIVANEAKDNVKYLYTLEKFFKVLGKCTPISMLEHIPSLLNSIRLIQNVSRYYNSSEHMTSLFVKVTNQMVTTCKLYLCQGVTKIWDLDRKELLKRVQECLQLNQEYQQCFQRVWDELQQSPLDRQFEFSENYIFGKFDAFCKRLENIADMATTLEDLSALQLIKVEGIEKILVRCQTIVTSIKSKTYNVLDHRKKETEQLLDLLSKFEKGVGNQIDLSQKYETVLQHFAHDLEQVRKLYQKHKDHPPIPRNMPPVAGRIMWARQLFRKIELPMEILKDKLDILGASEVKKIIRMYNKMAAVLVEYEVLYHRGWVNAAGLGQQGLSASLLIRHPTTKVHLLFT
ncbi:hypothetical protein AOLI_G00044350 [Acnodon oligacanthus]